MKIFTSYIQTTEAGVGVANGFCELDKLPGNKEELESLKAFITDQNPKIADLVILNYFEVK